MANHLANVELTHQQLWQIATTYLPEFEKLLLREYEAFLQS
jgi:hypothetical protein